MNNGNCTQLCLPLGSKSLRCACAMGFALASDGKTCQSVDTFLIYSTATGTVIFHVTRNQGREEVFHHISKRKKKRVRHRTDYGVVLTKSYM